VTTTFALVAVVGYLLGALPFGWLVARMHGVNIFAVGSKSPGATNVRRTLGARAGNLVFVLDAAKGAAAAGWPHLVLPHAPQLVSYCLVSLVAALLGHAFSCFTRFKGGKGVATGTGGLLVLLPGSTLVAAVVWVLAFYTTGYVSLASILAAVTLPLAAAFIFQAQSPKPFLFAAILISLFVIGRHRENIGRLISGTENKFQKKKGDEA
jgi:acyl phosphate:glycerol-3-phosphate acyltransferase